MLRADEVTIDGAKVEIGEEGTEDGSKIVEAAETRVIVCVVVLVSEMVEAVEVEVVSPLSFSFFSGFVSSAEVETASTFVAVLSTGPAVLEGMAAVSMMASQPPSLHTLVAPAAGASPMRRPSHLATQYVVRFSMELDPIPEKR